MSFDVAGARQAGYSDREIVEHLSPKRDFDVDGAVSAGYSFSEIADHMAGMAPDETTLLGSVGEAIKRVPGGLARGITSTFTGAGQLIPGLDDDMLVDTQRDIDQYIRETLNYDPAYDDSNIAAIGEGIGQIGSFLIPGLGAAKFAAAGKAAQKAAQRGLTTGVAASQSLALGAEERRQAEDRGIEISGGEEALSKASDVAIGALETFGMPFRVLRGLPKGWERTPDGSVFMRRLRSALKGAGREGVQEVVSSVARDLSASAIYDPERSIGESAADEFAVGAGAGGIFDFGFSLATGRYKRKAPPPPGAVQEPTEEEAEVEARLREEQAGRAEAGRQQAIDAARGEQSDLDRLDAGPPTAELAGRIGEEGVQIPDRSEEARTRFLNANDLDLPQYDLDVETADASVITERIANRLAERLPLGAEFDAASEVIEVGDPTTESGKRQIGPRIRDEQKRQEVANRLSEASRRLKQDVETEYTVTQSGLEYNPRQAEEVNRFGRVLPSTEARVLTADEVNTATETDRTGTFDEDLKNMSPAQLEELGIPRSRWTMAQRINASRAKQGLSEVNTFTLSELRGQNKGDIGNLGSVLAGKDLESAAFPERADQDAGAALDPNRPRQPITPVGRRPSLEYSAKTFDNVLSSNNAFNRLLSTKQMNLSLGSQEMRGLIKSITGKTPSKKAPLENLSPQERQYLYHSIRRMPRFTDPTQIPDFSRQVPDAEAVRVLRNRVETGRTGGIGAVAEGLLGGMKRPVSRAEVDRTVREAERTAQKTERETVDPIPEGQGLVTYDPEATDLAQKLRDMVAGFGLSDVVATRLVDRVGQATFDAQGNIIIPQDPVKAQEDSEQGYVTEGTFDPMTNVIQVGLDLVRQKVEQGGKTYEQAVAEVMSHEIIHALRQFDLFTPAEFSLLERMTRKYQKPGTGGTYANWASGLYSEKSAVEVQEEAIAEMISDALTDGVIIDGKQTKPSGKIRQLLQKIVDLFRSIAGFSRDVDVDSFAELVDRVKSGEVGARERGVVRTLNLTEKIGALPPRDNETRVFEDRAAERGITKEQLAYRETPVEGVRGVGDTARSVRSDQPMVDEAMASRSRDLPPAENAQRTQVANTIGTYRKAGDILDKMTGGDRGLDFSSGLGLGANELGFESYEPFARAGVSPTYTSGEQIPAGAFDKITNLNTLNVVPREDRDTIVKSIASALAPNGIAVITTRGKEVMNAKGRPGPEPNSIITSRDTYQKGFTKPELVAYLKKTLGNEFEVLPLNLGPAGATVKRLTEAKAGDKSVKGKGREADKAEIDAPSPSRRAIDPERVEKTVQENIAEAEKSGPNVPKYSVKASPEAQYIARNPEAAISIDQPVESRSPNYDAQTQSAIDGLVGDRPERVDPMKQFMDATGETSTLGYQFTRAKQAAVNRYARLEKLNKKFFNNFLADTSSIAAVLFADRSRGVTAEAIKSGVPIYEGGLTQVVDFQHNGKKYRGLIDIIDLLMTKEHGDLSKLAQAYAISVRGKRLNEDGSVSPVTEEKARQIREAVAKYTDADGNNPIIEWYGAWQAYNNQVIKFLEDTGVISGEVSDNWREASDYIPFYRALDPNANIGKITKGAFGDLTKAGSFIPYKGSEAVVDIPLVEAIVKNVGAAIDMGMRNVAQQRIARDMQTLQLAKQIPMKGDRDYPTATFKVNGKPVRFEIYDPLIFESMQAIDSSGIENFSRMYFGPFSNILRESVTRSPGFMIANMMRDTLSAFVTSGANFIPIYDTVKNAASDISRLEKTGVVGGYDFSVGTGLLGDDNIQKSFEREIKRRNKEGSQLNIFTSLWDGLGRMTTRSDAATRQAVFDDVYARTGNLAEAHFQALEVLNFSRRGSNPVMRAITAAIPFLNARIQGLDVLFRGMVGSNSANKELDKTQAALSFAMRGMLISAFTAMYWMLTSDDDEYKEARREERDNNWIIPLGDGRPALKIPIPFEVGFIFKTLPETFLDTTFGERTGKQAFETVKRGVTSTLEFDPIFGIQAIAPVLEASVNHNSYTGGTVVPVWMSGLLPEEQKTEFTSELGQFIGNAMNISPMKIDHVLKGYTGTMGIYVLDWTDRAVRDPDIAERLKSVGVNITSPEFPAVASYELPIVRRFFASPQGTGLKQDFYDLYSDVRQTYNSINKLRKEGRYEELEELIARRGTLLDVKAGVYNLKQQLDVVRRRKTAIRRSEDIAPERKREMIEEIEDYENSMLAIVPEFEKRADRPVTRMFQ